MTATSPNKHETRRESGLVRVVNLPLMNDDVKQSKLVGVLVMKNTNNKTQSAKPIKVTKASGKVIKVAVKASGKAVGKSSGKGTGKGKAVAVPTGVNQPLQGLRQVDAIGKLEEQYKGVFRYSPKMGHRFQLQVADGQVDVYKFSPSGRKFRYVGTEKTVNGTVQKIKHGAYMDMFRPAFKS